VFHHHIGTWVETPEETAKFLSLTDPDVIGLCFDTGHYRFGGGDPVAGLRRHADRNWHVHFKDHDPRVAELSRRYEWDAIQSVEHGVFCELGKGDVDFPAVVQTLKDIGYGGWIVVEQDVLPGMGTPRESAQRNALPHENLPFSSSSRHIPMMLLWSFLQDRTFAHLL
jgi:inosose dehydratase